MTQQNTYESGEKSQWYTNKDLFIMLQENNKEFADSIRQTNEKFAISINKANEKMDGLSDELKITRQEMKQYNDLRGSLNKNIKDVSEIKQELANDKAKKKGMQAVGNFVIKWGGWLIVVLTFLGKVFNWY